MSIPLDRLYNFLRDHCDQDIVIYRWFPHGSRKVENCKPLDRHIIDADFATKVSSAIMVCHDQEPLQFSDFSLAPQYLQVSDVPCSVFRAAEIVPYFNLYDRYLLCHSEPHSRELEQFVQDGAIPVYYWSHGVIARDWFRFAQHDPALKRRNVKKPFLVYNRAWSGTREYRLKFAELLVQHNVSQHCIMGFNPTDNGQDYRQHQFKNLQFVTTNQNLEQHFFFNQTPATASADYCAEDYQHSEIEVVLETLYDDTRWHLTEKTLRPIACGQPFIIMGTQGSLEYLRSYGFETFRDYIDESYDQETDPLARMQKVIDLMRNLAQNLNQDQIRGMRAIAARNQQRFFSSMFMQHLLDEFKQNFEIGWQQMHQHLRGTYFFHGAKKSPEPWNTTLFRFNGREQYQQVMSWFESAAQH